MNNMLNQLQGGDDEEICEYTGFGIACSCPGLL